MGRVRIYMCLLSWIMNVCRLFLWLMQLVLGKKGKNLSSTPRILAFRVPLAWLCFSYPALHFLYSFCMPPIPWRALKKFLSKQGLWVTMKIPDLKNTWFPNDRSSAISISGQAVETAGSHGFWIPGAPSQRRSDTSAMLSGTQLPGHHPEHDSRTPHSLTQILSLTIVQKNGQAWPLSRLTFSSLFLLTDGLRHSPKSKEHHRLRFKLC